MRSKPWRRLLVLSKSSPPVSLRQFAEAVVRILAQHVLVLLERLRQRPALPPPLA